jgi:hypothetical protein
VKILNGTASHAVFAALRRNTPPTIASFSIQ